MSPPAANGRVLGMTAKRKSNAVRNRRTGISLLEILVSMIILALVLVGLANVFVMSKGYIIHSRSRISAGELSKQFLDPLQTYVNQETWETGNMLSQDGNPPGATVNINNVDFTSHYDVSAGPPGTELRKVTVNITWDEPES